MVQRRLGRGLEFLLGDSRTRGSQESGIAIDSIDVNPSQPRQTIDESALEQLKRSIQTHGLLQPLVVRRQGDRYTLIAGERRWRACRDLGIQMVPVVIREETGEADLELALIENLQRENLTAIEEAAAYRELQQAHGLTHEMIAARVGKSRPYVSNRIRLLDLEPEILEAVSRGTITPGHARALLGIEDHGKRIEAFRSLLSEEASVREVESRARERSEKKSRRRVVAPEVREIEERLSKRYGTRARVMDKGNRGRVTFDYRSLDEFEALCRKLDGED